MPSTLRRTALLISLMFWQGGFMFYGAVVVPVGSKVLASHTVQGFITRSVTNYLNGAGGVCLVVWGWLLAKEGHSDRRRLRWSLLVLIIVAHGLLLGLHVWLDKLLDPEKFQILDLVQYRLLHQWYLIISTLQWACSIWLLGCTVRTWESSLPRSGVANN